MKNKLTVLFILIVSATYGLTGGEIVLLTGDQTDIQGAITSLNGNGTITIKGDINITSALPDSIPRGIELKFFKGNKLILAPGVDLIINGTINAGVYPIFELKNLPGDLSSQGNVVGSNITEAYPEWFGALADGVTDDTQAILKTIHFLRKNLVLVPPHMNETPIEMYSSGTVRFSSAIYLIKSNFLIRQDLGLTFSGNGSRRSTNAVFGATTLLFDSASDENGYCIKTDGHGGRSLTLENMDICYNNAAFYGSVIDNFSSPGLNISNCYVGAYELDGNDIEYSAKSLLRTTYDEFINLKNCVFSGAKHAWWADTTRDFKGNGNKFGGFSTQIENCVFYDFTSSHIFHHWTEPVDDDVRRTKLTVNILSCAFNPIRNSPTDPIIKMRNVNGLNLIGNTFTHSTSNTLKVKWLDIYNVTGIIKSNSFGDNADIGNVSGMLEITANAFYGEDGFVLKGGVISSSNNKISKATTGFKIEPEYPISFNLGPDLFKSEVTNSYVIPNDNIFLSGSINYSMENDASNGKFINTSDRVKVENKDYKRITIAVQEHNISILNTGRIFSTTSSADQVLNLPIPVPGTELTIVKMSNSNLQIKTHPGTNFFLGEVNALTIATADNTNIGGTIKLKAFGTAGWLVMKQGNWVFL